MDNRFSKEDQLNCYKRNMVLAAQQLSKNDIIGVIEPINKYSVPNYFLNNYEDGK